MKQPLRIGIVGTQGHTNIVFEGLREETDVSIDAVCPSAPGEPVERLLRRTACLRQQPRVMDDWQRLLDQPLDAVVVAGRIEEHTRITVAALQRGLHVLCEKPVAPTAGDDVDLRAALTAHPGRLVVPMLPIRHEPAFYTAHQLVTSGAIGDVRLINAQKSYRLGRRDATFHRRATSSGTIPWVGAHAIDWVHWFSGRAFASVSARHTTRANRDHGELEATAVLQFELDQEVYASVTLDYLRPESAPSHGDDRVRVVGEAGVVEVRNDTCYLTNADARGERRCESLTPPRTFFGAFLSAVRGESDPPVMHAELVAVNEACLLARDSADRRETLLFPC